MLWLVLPGAYVASFGPVSFAVGRGWIHPHKLEIWYWPLVEASQLTGLWESLECYHYDCRDRGRVHASR